MPGQQTQVAVIGAGAAGLYTALCAARLGARVTLVSATPLAESSSYWAQGGLAAALAQDDSPAKHFADTVTAGRGAVRESAARVLCDEAPAAVADLASLGVQFDADRHGNYALGLEGGHSARRVVHAGGAATGRRIVRQLSALVAQHERIEVLENRRVSRVETEDGRATGVSLDDGTALASPAIVLATGGAAALWSRTTNPPGAVGSGLLLAHDAGAQLADLELLQFPPAPRSRVRRRTAPTGDGSWSPRRSAARARACWTPPASGSSTSSRRATRSRARSSGRSTGPAREPSGSTCATSIRRCSRTSSAPCGGPESTPSAS